MPDRHHGPSRLHAEMIARAALETARCCARLGLLCGDPPAATARLLYWLGYPQAQVRGLWRVLPAGRPLRIEVYRYRGSSFRLEVRHSIGPLRELDEPGRPPCPLGPMDWRGRRHLFAPRAHRVYVYLSGGVGGSGVHINVARLLSLMESSAPGSLGELEGLVDALIWGRATRWEAASRLLGLIGAWSGVLSRLLPRLPMSVDALVAMVPPIRHIG